MPNNIITQGDPGIVAKERPVSLSDEKLKTMLSRTYECAQKDMNSTKFRNFYSIFLSIAGTLFLSLLTSSFNAFGNVSSETVTLVVSIICVAFAVLGFILLALTVKDKTTTDTSARDKAVDEIFKSSFK